MILIGIIAILFSIMLSFDYNFRLKIIFKIVVNYCRLMCKYLEPIKESQL